MFKLLEEVFTILHHFSTFCKPFSRSGNIKVVYGNSTHPQRSAPQHIPLENLPEIRRLEELLCERRPQAGLETGAPATGPSDHRFLKLLLLVLIVFCV